MTSRTTSVALALAGALLPVGCSDKYAHERLDMDSPEAEKVRKMLTGLRDAGESGLDEIVRTQGAGGLSDAQAKMLRGTLLEIVKADSVELDQMDRFGKDVWRAIFKLTRGASTSTVPVLIVIPNDGRPRWAGRN